MGLFGKKKEEKSCCCGDSCTPEKMAQAEAAKTTAGVKVLGSGCAKCHALEDATRAALAELNMDTTIDHVTDFSQIVAYGVMTTPALVVDGKVVSYGKVLNKDEVKKPSFRRSGDDVWVKNPRWRLSASTIPAGAKSPRHSESIWPPMYLKVTPLARRLCRRSTRTQFG